MKNTIGLLCKLPRVNHLQQLCDLAYQILGNPVFVSDLAHTILAYTKCVEIDDPTWQTNIVHSSLDRNTLRQEREVGIVHEDSSGDRKPVLVTDSHLEYPRIIKALMNKNQPVGVMVTTSYLKPFAEEDMELVELISSFVVPLLLRERYFVSDEKHAIENYFIKLLDGEQVTQDQVNKRLDILGFREKPYTYVLCIGTRGEGDRQPHRMLSDVLNHMRSLVSGCVFPYNACLVCVYGSDNDINDWDEQAPELAGLLLRENLQAGVSRRIRGLEGLHGCYLQAVNALETGLRLERHELFQRYDSLSSFTLFRMIPVHELDRYCHEKIRALGEYDAAHGMELCVTLQVYLEQAKSLAKTSEILFIHRNTVRYRIKKCMELMNTELEDGNEIFAYILSLRILEYLRKFPQEAQ